LIRCLLFRYVCVPSVVVYSLVVSFGVLSLLSYFVFRYLVRSFVLSLFIYVVRSFIRSVFIYYVMYFVRSLVRHVSLVRSLFI